MQKVASDDAQARSGGGESQYVDFKRPPPLPSRDAREAPDDDADLQVRPALKFTTSRLYTPRCGTLLKHPVTKRFIIRPS